MADWQEYTTEDDEAKIWRFMDFEKFVDLISCRSLYFARVDRLGDPFEGSLLPEKLLKADGDYSFLTAAQKEQQRSLGQDHRMRTVVSCWDLNEHESAAMWRLYMPEGKGLAIRSTVGNAMAPP